MKQTVRTGPKGRRYRRRDKQSTRSQAMGDWKTMRAQRADAIARREFRAERTAYAA